MHPSYMPSELQFEPCSPKYSQITPFGPLNGPFCAPKRPALGPSRCLVPGPQQPYPHIVSEHWTENYARLQKMLLLGHFGPLWPENTRAFCPPLPSRRGLDRPKSAKINLPSMLWPLLEPQRGGGQTVIFGPPPHNLTMPPGTSTPDSPQRGQRGGPGPRVGSGQDLGLEITQSGAQVAAWKWALRIPMQAPQSTARPDPVLRSKYIYP